MALCSPLGASASGQTDVVVLEDSADHPSLALPDSSVAPWQPFFKRLHKTFDNLLRSWSDYDTTYIEPQQYDFGVMMQHTQVYQYSRMKMGMDHSLSLSPDVVFKIGPYLGWRWVFLGYTLDVRNLFKSTDGTYFDLSLYSNKIGVDLYYIDNGNNFKIRHLNLGPDISTRELSGHAIKGFSERTLGFNLYYILNNHHFSYPAAFNQSTRQLRNAGSALVGLGYASHTFNLNREELIEDIRLTVPHYEKIVDALQEDLKEDLGERGVKYKSFTLSAGYGYNYVIAPCFLVAGSLAAGLSCNVLDTAYRDNFINSMSNMLFKNLSVDLTARLGFVYNNSRWFAGFSAIAHNYNYYADHFTTRNFFGTLNVYAGFNFSFKKKK